MKNTLLGLAGVLIIVGGAYYFNSKEPFKTGATNTTPTNTQYQTNSQVNPTENRDAEGDPFYNDEHIGLDNGADYRISASTTALVGVWQSSDDAKFKREFKAGGVVIDTYTGQSAATASSQWSVFTKESPDKSFTGTFESGAIYLKMYSGVDSLYFKLVKVTPEELEMVYLAKGNTLKFIKK